MKFTQNKKKQSGLIANCIVDISLCLAYNKIILFQEVSEPKWFKSKEKLNWEGYKEKWDKLESITIKRNGIFKHVLATLIPF